MHKRTTPISFTVDLSLPTCPRQTWMNRNHWIYTQSTLNMKSIKNIYLKTNIRTMKFFHPTHHTCKWSPRASRLVPSHCVSRGGRGDYTGLTVVLRIQLTACWIHLDVAAKYRLSSPLQLLYEHGPNEPRSHSNSFPLWGQVYESCSSNVFGFDRMLDELK